MKLSRSAPPARGRAPLKAGQTAGGVALDREDRMHDEANVEAALGELGQHRIDQERHVVVDDLEHRVGA